MNIYPILCVLRGTASCEIFLLIWRSNCWWK